MTAIQPNLGNYQPVTSVLGTTLPSGVASTPKSNYVNSLSSLNLSNVGTPQVPGVTNTNVLPPGFGGLNTSSGATAPVATKITPTTTAPATSSSSGLGSYKGVQITPGTDAQVAAQIAAIDGGNTGGSSSNPALNTPSAQNYLSTLGGSGTSTATGTSPAGWDAATYAAFKAANPNLEPTAQDTANMQNAGGASSTNQPSTVQAYTQNADGSFTYAPYQAGTPGAPGYSTPPVNTGNPTYDAAINSYLTALNSSNAINERVQKTTLDANNQQEGDINAPGGTLGGNQATAALDNRENNLSLANLGIAQGAATDAKNVALQAAQFAQSALPTPAAPFTLSPGETRYDASGKPIATVSPAASASKTIGTPATGVYQQNADGSWTQTLAPVGGDNVQSLAQQLVTGNLAPADLSKRSTGVGSYNDILNTANQISESLYGKPFDIAKASTDYTYANNKTTQDTLNYLGSLVGSVDGSQPGNLDQLITLSKQVAEPSGLFGLGQSNFPALNDATQWAKLSSGDPTVAAYYATLLETSDQVAKVLQGGGNSGTSDAKLAQAQSLFQKGFTKDQISAVAGTLKTLLANRATSMIGDNPYLSTYATEFGISQNNNKGSGSTSTDTGSGGIYDF